MGLFIYLYFVWFSLKTFSAFTMTLVGKIYDTWSEQFIGKNSLNPLNQCNFTDLLLLLLSIYIYIYIYICMYI